MSWVQYDANRKQYVNQLLSLVKLPLLSPKFLFEHVVHTVGSDPACLKLILEAMKWHLMPECRPQMTSIRSRPRKSTLGKLMVVGGMDKNKGATTIECYDPRIGQWSVEHSMNGRRLQFGIALIGNK